MTGWIVQALSRTRHLMMPSLRRDFSRTLYTRLPSPPMR
ncbi:leader peptide SpeFL [Gibbsiella dentisursi]